MSTASPLYDYDEVRELTFDQLLAVLLSLLRQLVTVSVSAAEDTPPLTLTVVGVLERGTDINPPSKGEEHETFPTRPRRPPSSSTGTPSEMPGSR
jgi:hypothetical protein